MPISTLDDLLLHELRDLLNAERQLLKALPRFAKAATDETLVGALEDHLLETETQVERLVECFVDLGLAARGKRCAGMEGLINEGLESLGECDNDDVCDAAIISAAQRIEHYEISAYGTARSLARRLGQDRIAERLGESLLEEATADEVLSIIAEGGVNLEAEGESEALPPAPPSDLIPTTKATGGNGHAKLPDPKVHDGILKPKPNLQARPVVERKWRRGLGAH
jgi:ferritin-like metal-binding protein YciE